MSTLGSALLSRVLHAVDAAIDGEPAPDTVPTGFPSVDRLLGGGMRRGDLVALGGDVGSGKSAFALGVALRAAAAGHRVAFVTAEAGPERVVARALCIEGRASLDALRTGALDDDARTRVGAAALRLRDLPLSIDALPAARRDALDAAAAWGAAPVLVIVDMLQSLAPGERPLDEELASAARHAKEMARERNAAVLLLAQLPGSTTPRADRRPVLADFGALGAVSHHADVVLALYREEMYGAAPGTTGGAELLVLKNRHGATGYEDLYFQPDRLRFEDMLDPER